MAAPDLSVFDKARSFRDFQQEAEEFQRRRAMENEALQMKRREFELAEQKAQAELQALSQNRGPFTGTSIEAQMANALAAQGYTPDQIAELYYTKTVTLPNGGIAAVTPQARGLGAPRGNVQTVPNGTPSPNPPPVEIGDLSSPGVGQPMFNDILPTLDNLETGMTGQAPTGGRNDTLQVPPTPSQFSERLAAGVIPIVQPEAGDEGMPVNEEAARLAAEQLGVPYVPLNTRGLSGNQRAMLIRRAAEDARKRLESDELQQARTRASGNIQDASRWLQLQDKQTTGGWQSVPIARQASRFLDPEFSEMETISARLTPQQRVPGSGATSDFDAKMFLRAVMGVDKPEQANRNIATAMQLAGQREIEYQDFLNRYAEANGTLDGAQQRWKEYADANPIFAPNSDDYSINPNRVSFREYFGRPQTAGAPTNIQQDNVVNWEDLP